MTEYIITKKSNLIAVADSVRGRTGETGKITLGEMIDNINYDIGGVELPELTNEGTASDLLAGKQLIDQEGNIVEGTIATKTSSNLTASGATVTVPSGYYATQATKSVATTTQATPSISIDSTGKITATATQTAGYVAAGSKSATKQLAFQPAKTITPTTASQIAVSSGYYTGGNVTVVGDSNLIAENIKSGVSIFGVSGTYAGSNIGDAIITGTISNYTNDWITTINSGAFYGCSQLQTVSFPAATSISDAAFYGCRKLQTVSFPAVETIGSSAFIRCYNLKSLYLTGSSLCKLSASRAFSSTPIGGYSTSAGTYGSIYVPASLLTSYKTATNWTYFSSRFVGI